MFFLKTMTLNAGGSGGYINQMNDYLMSENVQNVAYDVKKYKPYVLFLNGEYWGFYWLTEKFDANYLSKKYNLESEDLIIIKEGEIEEGYDEDLAQYHDMLQFFMDNDLAEDKVMPLHVN